MRNSVRNVTRHFVEYLRRSGIVPGDRIPAERELADELQTSRTTLRKVLQLYEKQGLIEKRQQAGTFLVRELPPIGKVHDPVSTPSTADSRLISVMLVGSDEKYQVEQRFIHDYLQSKQYLMNLYITTKDHQDPGLERAFFESLFDLNVRGVMVIPTPLQPVNTDIMQKLEKSGIHLAHIGYYRYELPDQAFFLCDYECAGRLAVQNLARKQCKKLVFNPLNEFDFENAAPFMQRLCQGIKDEANACGIEIIRYRLPHSHLDRDTAESRSMCENLPPETGIITQSSHVLVHEMTKVWGNSFAEMPIVAIGYFDLDFPIHDHVPTYGFYRLPLLRDAMDYLVSPESAPAHRLYKPEFRLPAKDQ